MIKELIPQENANESNLLKTFLTQTYTIPDVQRYITYTLRPFSEKVIDKWLATHLDENVHYYVFLKDGVIAGLALGEENEEDGYELVGLMVLPDYQGTGIGRALIDHVIQVAKSANWTSILVRVFADNKRMLKLVIDEGFVPIQIDYHKRADGADVVQLKKYL
jgi:GNAT superfamily N-acetyltransferase